MWIEVIIHSLIQYWLGSARLKLRCVLEVSQIQHKTTLRVTYSSNSISAWRSQMNGVKGLSGAFILCGKLLVEERQQLHQLTFSVQGMLSSPWIICTAFLDVKIWIPDWVQHSNHGNVLLKGTFLVLVSIGCKKCIFISVLSSVHMSPP